MASDFIRRYLDLQAIALSLALLVPGLAQAGPVADRIKAQDTIHCGGSERPGLLDQAEDGTLSGMLVDLCHAVGAAVAGPGVKVDMHVYYADETFDPIRKGKDDLSFLSGGEIVEQKLAGAIVPGPTVFIETSAVMVAKSSPVTTLGDLTGQKICFLQGDVSHRHLEAALAARHLDVVRMGYQEPVEMYDAFDAQKCTAIVGEATTLGDIRTDGGPNRRDARILAEPLASFPIVAATGTQDAAWSSAVGWIMAALDNADRPQQDWTVGGPDALPIDLSALGLPVGWQRAAVAANGSYGAILRRNIGGGSALKLPSGPNALSTAGGLLAPPYSE